MKYLVRVLGAVMVVAGSCWLWAQEKPASKTANSGKSALDNLLDGTERGTLFRLVTSDDKPLQPLIYWRTMPGTVAASVPPVEFRLGDAELIAPKVDPQGAAEPTYPISGRAELKAGKYTITPGNLALEVTAAGITSNHPAIKVASGPAGQEVLIRCAPVRLEAVDTRGVPQPMPARVTWGNKSLLRKDARFTMLTLWLPLGSDYATSLGTVRVTETGQVQPLKGELAEGVQLVAGGLRRTVPMTSPPVDTLRNRHSLPGR